MNRLYFGELYKVQYLQSAARPRQPSLHLHHPAVFFLFVENVYRKARSTREDRHIVMCVARTDGNLLCKIDNPPPVSKLICRGED
jgi:hypothetical protein